MVRLTLIITLIFALTQISYAQVHATTDDGKSVLLYNNGTWQYENNMEESPAVMTEPSILPSIIVDSSRDITSDRKEFFLLPSPRLVKYFGENGGRIRCKLSSSNILGSVKIQFSWEFPVIDSDRYFGSFGEGTEVILTMSNDQQVKMVISGKSDIKRLEKSNYSVITNSTYPLNNVQLATLTELPISKMEVDWKKRPEEYDIENSHILMDLLPTVF